MPELTARKRARLSWILPPALALIAVGLQLAIDVPHHAMILREDPKPEKKTTTAARTPRTPTKYRARGAAYTGRLRKSWSKRPIADEPKDPRFAEHHEELLRIIARKAEAAAVPADDPVLVSTHATCHTVRCDLELCAPPDRADAIVEHLPKFKVGSRSLWHELREIESDSASSATRVCHRYIVDFAIEGADPRSLRLGR